MYLLQYRRDIAAQTFLSNISLDGGSFKKASNPDHSNNEGTKNCISSNEGDEQERSSSFTLIKHAGGTIQAPFITWKTKLDAQQLQRDDVIGPKKSVFFNTFPDVEQCGGLSGKATPYRCVSSPESPNCSISPASVTPIGLDELNDRESVHHQGRRRSSTDSSSGLLSSIFCHANRSNSVAHQTSVGQDDLSEVLTAASVLVAKPLNNLKRFDSVERSYAHLLVSRKLQDHPARLARRLFEALENEAVTASTSNVSGTCPTLPLPEPDQQPSQRQRGRSHTLSTSSIFSLGSRKTNNSPLHEVTLHQHGHLTNTSPRSSDSGKVDSPLLVSRCRPPLSPVQYTDPLISYDPLLLDDPSVLPVTNRRVSNFSGFVSSIIGYQRPNEYKRDINREFQQRFPKIQLTLSKMRSIKLTLLLISLRMNLDLWNLAHAYVLFEKMILKLFICKANRKVCAGAALLISAKLNDLKGALLPSLIQQLESEFRVSRRDLLSMELAAFIGLEFSVLPLDSEVMPHLKQINKSLGLHRLAPPNCLPAPVSIRE